MGANPESYSAPGSGPPGGLADAIGHLAKSGRKSEAIAGQFKSLADKLLWRRGRTGPFASLNFGNTHSHAVLVGRGERTTPAQVELLPDQGQGAAQGPGISEGAKVPGPVFL